MERGGLTRRDFLRLSAAAATGALVAACAPAAPQIVEVEKQVPVEKVEVQTVVVEKEVPVEKVVERVVLKWWFGWGGHGQKALEAVGAKFNEISENIKVEPLQTADVNTKLLTAIAGGVPPDVESGNLMYPEYWARGVVLPLTDWIDASDVIDKEDFPAPVWDFASWKGEIYGVPAIEGFVRESLGYNVGLVEEAGLDPENPPQTWDEVFEWHKAITQRDAAGNLVIVGFDPLNAMAGTCGGPDPFMWPLSYGFDYFDEKNLKFNLDDPRLVDALYVIKKFYDDMGAEALKGFRQSYGEWLGPQSGFASGVEGMIIIGGWAPVTLARTGAEGQVYDFSWLPVSSDRKGVKVQALGGHFGVIPKGSRYPEAAFEFLEFLTTDTACDIIWEIAGWPPARYSYLRKMDTTGFRGLDFMVRSLEEADELRASEPNPIASFTHEQWNDNADAVIYGDRTPEQAVKDMQRACTEALQKAELA